MVFLRELKIKKMLATSFLLIFDELGLGAKEGTVLWVIAPQLV